MINACSGVIGILRACHMESPPAMSTERGGIPQIAGNRANIILSKHYFFVKLNTSKGVFDFYHRLM